MCCFVNIFTQNVEVFLLSNSVCIYHFYESQQTYLGKNISLYIIQALLFLMYRTYSIELLARTESALHTQPLEHNTVPINFSPNS